jgi:hypothetical protein
MSVPAPQEGLQLKQQDMFKWMAEAGSQSTNRPSEGTALGKGEEGQAEAHLPLLCWPSHHPQGASRNSGLLEAQFRTTMNPAVFRG